MGTRNITLVVLNKEFKVAQYGQWDGYPESMGVGVLDFLRNVDLKNFKQKVEKLTPLTDIEIDKVLEINYDDIPKEFVRDTGYKILHLINEGKTDKVYMQLDFAADGLFCEWGYLIDLDTNKLEVYEGFDTTPLTEKDRFYFLQKNVVSDTYKPIHKIAEYDLNNLPSNETLINECSNQDLE